MAPIKNLLSIRALFFRMVLIAAALAVNVSCHFFGPPEQIRQSSIISSFTAQLEALRYTSSDNPGMVRLAGGSIIDVLDEMNTAITNARKFIILDLYDCYAGDSIQRTPVDDMSDLAGNSYIKGIILPSTLKIIGDYAFNNCDNLTSITIPASVTTIGDSAFYGCTGLTNITIPAGITTIGNSAFEGCIGLTSITIPTSITIIGYSVFFNCTGLTSITIPTSVTAIGAYAFIGCTGLTSITIPTSVTTIWDYAFAGCTGVTSITIPTSVTTIGPSAFNDCTGLTSITIPAGVTTIWDYAFAGCTGLTSITIPTGVTTIASGAFSSCVNLASITFEKAGVDLGNIFYSHPDVGLTASGSLHMAYDEGGAGTYTGTIDGTWTKSRIGGLL